MKFWHFAACLFLSASVCSGNVFARPLDTGSVCRAVIGQSLGDFNTPEREYFRTIAWGVTGGLRIGFFNGVTSKPFKSSEKEVTYSEWTLAYNIMPSSDLIELTVYLGPRKYADGQFHYTGPVIEISKIFADDRSYLRGRFLLTPTSLIEVSDSEMANLEVTCGPSRSAIEGLWPPVVNLP